MKNLKIVSRNLLSESELVACQQLNRECQIADGSHRQPYLSNMLNFDKSMPAFLLAYKEDTLLGLLAVYADDKEDFAEVSLLVRPDVRRRGIGSQLLACFERIQKEHQLLGPLFVTEQVFLEHHPNLLKNMNLVADEERETWLCRNRQPFEDVNLSDLTFALAVESDIPAIANFQSRAFDTTLEVSEQYAKEAIQDENSILYIIKNNEKVLGSCTVDLSTSYNYLYGLAVDEDARGRGIGTNLVKLVINDLIERNSKDFQIAVEEENEGAWMLYRKLGFEEQTQIVYLKGKN
ncbi:TPA: GNAT family N-acetyltransferase [Streptococcus suis]